MTEQWQYEVTVDAAVSRRLLASQLAHERRGLWVTLAILLVVGCVAAVILFESPALAGAVVVVLLAVAVASYRRKAASRVATMLPPGTTLRSRFDAHGFDLSDSRGSSGRTPWTVVTSVDHEPGSGTVTWRSSDGMAWTVPEEIFPEGERARWHDR